MKIYITAPFKNNDNKAEIEELCLIVNKAGYEDYCFVRDSKVFNNDHELMLNAKNEIQKCEALLIDYDGPATGRMIELGIAYAMNKKIIIITKKGTYIKDSVKGVADVIIEYDKLEDVVLPLSKSS